MPALTGVPLSSLLASPAFNDSTKIRATTSAVNALHSAHECDVFWPDGNERRFSHSDAHAQNVFFDPASDRAHWFDFETIHAVSATTACRHADDLRALSFSVAAYSEERLWPEIASAIVNAYSDESVLGELCALSDAVAQH